MIFLGRLTVIQPHKKFPAFCGTKMFTGARHKSANTASWIQSTRWDCFFHNPHLRQEHPIRLSLSGFLKKISYIFLSCCMYATCLAGLVVIWSPSRLMDSTHYGASWCLMFLFSFYYSLQGGPGSSVGIVTDYGLDGPGSNPGGPRFSVRPDRPWGPPSLLYNGYRVFPGGKVRPGCAVDHSPPSSAAVMEE